jgi:hypothetical protein
MILFVGAELQFIKNSAENSTIQISTENSAIQISTENSTVTSSINKKVFFLGLKYLQYFCCRFAYYEMQPKETLNL